MKIIYRINCILVVLLLPFFSTFTFAQYQSPAKSTSEVPNTSYIVGSLPGSFGVSQIGAATYSIPLTFSPGTAGMSPSLSVYYNSNQENGILGKGWDLGGISEISRVQRTVYHDGAVDDIDMSLSDAFALDSMRLILISGTNGVSGAIYGTEIESFMRVEAKSVQGNGPQWFEAITKEGNVIQYGNTSDSRVEANGSTTILKWRVNRITDPNGNYIDYTYNEASGESTINEIKYTGNATEGLLPYNLIKFIYVAKNDPSFTFFGGFKVPQTKLLSTITVYTEGSTLVRRYTMLYHYDFYTHLNEIYETGSDESRINSTIVGWGTTADQYATESTEYSNYKKFFHGDFNGDGIMDLLSIPKKSAYTSADQWVLKLNNTGTPSSPVTCQGSLDAYFKDFAVVDVDGDGKDEVFRISTESTTYQCDPYYCSTGEPVYPGGALASGSATSGSATNVTASNSAITYVVEPPGDDEICWNTCTNSRQYFDVYSYDGTTLINDKTPYDITIPNYTDLTMYPADFDGDGDKDYMFLSPSKNLISFSGLSNNLTGLNFYSPSLVKIIDFNGDMKSDILVVKKAMCYVYSYNTLTERWETLYTSTSGILKSTDRIYTGDINGDKKTDVLYYRSGWYLLFSTGQSFYASSIIPPLRVNDPGASLTDNNYYIGDYNGDGKDDILEMYSGTSGKMMDVYYSKGDGSTLKESNTYSNLAIDEGYFSVVDYNSDGQDDVWRYDYQTSSTSNSVKVTYFHKNEQRDLVQSIRNGLGYLNIIEYFNLNINEYDDNFDTWYSIYTHGSAEVLPLVDYAGSLKVVCRVGGSDGLGDINYSYYFYEGAKKHLQGRGFLGFSLITSANIGKSSMFKTALSLDRTYNLLMPCTESSHTLAEPLTKKSGIALKRITIPKTLVLMTYTSYSDTISHLGNKRLFIKPRNISERNSNAYSYKETYFKYDSYGNPVYIKISSTLVGTVQDEITETSTMVYGSYGNGYNFKNRLENSTITKTYTNESPYSRAASFSYDSKGNLITEITDPGTTGQITKSYSINSYGLSDNVSVSAAGVPTLVNSFTYDDKYRFVKSKTNPLNQTEYISYDYGTGNIDSITDIGNLKITFEYNGFGQKIRSKTPDGLVTETNMTWAPGGGIKSSTSKTGSPGFQKHLTFWAGKDRLHYKVSSELLIVLKSMTNQGIL